MVVTILEAKINQANFDRLKAAYVKRTGTVPDSILDSLLAQDRNDPSTWQIITLWRSADDLAAMRDSGQIPTGVQIFNDVDAHPQLTVLEVRAKAR